VTNCDKRKVKIADIVAIEIGESALLAIDGHGVLTDLRR